MAQHLPDDSPAETSFIASPPSPSSPSPSSAMPEPSAPSADIDNPTSSAEQPDDPQVPAHVASIPIDKLSLAAIQAETERQRATDAYFYSSAPTFVSLHAELQQTLSQLDTLASYYSAFETELGGVSSHLTGLQVRSQQLDTQLVRQQAVDQRLSALVANVALSPLTIEVITSTDPKSQPQAWADACAELERVLNHTTSVEVRSGAPLSPTFIATTDRTTDAESSVRAEARALALSCLSTAVPKLRPYLTQAFGTFKASVTANLQVLQNSVLLKPTHRGLYGVLARRAPRAAQEVQRAYLSAARLYFETGFRRYTRSLEKIRVRSLGFQGPTSGAAAATTTTVPEPVGSGESTPVFGGANAGVKSPTLLERVAHSNTSSSLAAGEEVLIGDIGPSTVSAAALGLISRAAGASSRELGQLEREDTLFLLDDERAGQSRVNGPGVVLAYMADDPAFKATSEALFRSMALTFFDNASSEYTFLVRYFELSNDDPSISPNDSARPDQSTTNGKEDEKGQDHQNSIVQLSTKEQQDRPQTHDADTYWNQVMEPVLGHWKTFTTILLSSTPSPTLLSLLAMVQLCETLLSEAETRGVGAAVQGPLLAFKIQAWPLVTKSFDNHLASLFKVRNLLGLPDPDADTSSLSTWGFGLTGWVNAAASATTTTAPGEKMAHIRLTSARFARLFVATIHLSLLPYERMLFGSVSRVRDQIEVLIKEGCGIVADDEAKKTRASKVATEARANQLRVESYDLVLKTLNNSISVTSTRVAQYDKSTDANGLALTSRPLVRQELEHWTGLRDAVVQANATAAAA